MSTARKRSRGQQKRRMISVVAGVILLTVAGAGAFVWYQQREEKPTYIEDGTEASGQKENRTITHKGKEYVLNEHLSNYLFMGVDTRDKVESYEGQNDAGQADSIFLLSLNRMSSQITVISIPRDTMTKIEVLNPSGKSMGTTTDHINTQYAYGDGRHVSCDLMRQTVSSLLGGIPIEGYCSINMDAIPVITELAGNVEIVVPDDSLSAISPEFTKGATVTLTKENVEQFVRYRDTAQTQSALVRQSRQKVFLDGYLKKAQENYGKDPSFVSRLYEGIKPYMVTGMRNDLFVSLMEASIQNAPVELELPGKGEQGKYYDEYHVDEEALQDMILSVFYTEIN